MKPQYQTRYELLHESYQKWLTGFTRHAVSSGVCHPNIYYFHNLTPGGCHSMVKTGDCHRTPESAPADLWSDKRTTPPRMMI